jgi:putative thiamine transport system permease protein
MGPVQGSRFLAALPALLLLPGLLAASLLLLLSGFARASGFADFFAHPQFWGALGLTLFTGLASTALSLVLALAAVSDIGRNLARLAGASLAIPHLSFALAFGFLIMPSGVLARIIAVLFTGWPQPPDWVTTQDPHGLALTAALVLKETPFLIWIFTSLMNRDDLQTQFSGQMRVARSLGHGPASAFLRVVMPQFLARSLWPLVAVLTYGLTVVDMAVVIGPSSPPTLASIIWRDINDGELVTNARGDAGVLVLAGLVAAILLLLVMLFLVSTPVLRRLLAAAPRRGAGLQRLGHFVLALWPVLYGAAGITLALQSLAGLWPFPHLLPDHLSLTAWRTLMGSGSAIVTSLVLAFSTAGLALVCAVAWFESQPRPRDRLLLWPATLMLCLPSLVIALGQYRLFLQLDLAGTAVGLFLAHMLPVMAYVFGLLVQPYRSYDRRWQASAAGLGAARFRFLRQVKWPMLKAPLASAFAVGFAVSMAQYAPAQLAAAGRFTTLPLDAVTLSSGGNRALTAAYGIALAAAPLVIFLLAGRWGQGRWRAR